MPGRKRLPGTDAQRAAARRQQVRENVRAYRQRNRDRQLTGSGGESSDNPINPESSRTSSIGSETAFLGNEDFFIQTETNHVEVGREMIDNGVRWSLRLPLKISMGPAYTEAFISALQDRNNPESTDSASLSVQILSTPPNSSSSTIANDRSVISTDTSSQPATIHVEICCGKWITALTFQSMSGSSNMLKEALLAAALSLLSIERKDDRMRMQATQIQTQALRKLREGFDAYVNGVGLERATLLAATAMTCSMAELLVNKSWDGFSLHLRGVGALIEHGGISGLSADEAKNNFYGYRAVQLPFLLLERRSSFLSQPQWITFPWSADYETAITPFQLLCDIAFQLPVQIELYDNNNKSDDQQQASSLHQQLQTLSKIATDLDTWLQNLWQSTSPTPFSIQPAFWHGIPPSTLSAIAFPNSTIASSFLAYAGIQISLLSLVLQITLSLTRQEQPPNTDPPPPPSSLFPSPVETLLNWARTACSCIDALLSRGEIDTAKLAALFAFDRAWEVFAELSEMADVGLDLSEELGFCRDMAGKLEETGLPVLKRRT